MTPSQMPYNRSMPPTGERILSAGTLRIGIASAVRRECDFARCEDAGPVVAADGEFVGAVETHCRGHVDVECFVAAEATTDVLAIDEYAAVVLHAAEVHLESLTAQCLRDRERAPQPCPLVIRTGKITGHGASCPGSAGRWFLQLRHVLIFPRSIQTDLRSRFIACSQQRQQYKPLANGRHAKLSHILRIRGVLITALLAIPGNCIGRQLISAGRGSSTKRLRLRRNSDGDLPNPCSLLVFCDSAVLKAPDQGLPIPCPD